MSGQMLIIAKKMREIKSKKDKLEKEINNKFQRTVRRDKKQYSGDMSINKRNQHRKTRKQDQ